MTRSSYRIQYPVADRPRLLIDGTGHEVLDCSESGLRYRLEKGRPARYGQDVLGVVQFRRGVEIAVEGRIVRIEGDVAAIHFTAFGIPFGVILAEQRDLLRRYPMWR
ncbi:MAG: PilZ domain-containing protein [Gemmatimonadetes bacterium]|nr:PilZ domain-containing protein [Gemmatimonadota bacterium]